MDEPYIKAGFGIAAFTDQTNVHPVGLAVLLLLALALVFAPRRYAAIPILLMAALIPSAQKVAIFTLDFTFLRILVIFGVLRIVARGEHRAVRWQLMDKIFLAWVAVSFLMPLLRVGPRVLVFECGVAYDALGLYFIFRSVFRSWPDLFAFARACALVAVPVAAAFLFEHATRHNLFAVFGGVHEITVIRQGRLRCQGPYSHPILSGCFWAVLMPLVAARWWSRGHRWEAFAGTTACLAIVYCCASSTPVLGVAAAALAAGTFFLRQHLRLVRWLTVFGLVGLHFLMNAPVWHLICRVSAVGGSTGWHRFHLVDQFIRRCGEWALVGTNGTAHWGYYLFDVTNYYVAQGVTGGVLRLGLFITLMALTFRGIGRLARAAVGDAPRLATAWALGVAFFAQAACFIGVSYFGQIIMLWYLFPALVASLEEQAARVSAPGPAGSRVPRAARMPDPLSQRAHAPARAVISRVVSPPRP